jgi:hypothetical protein
MNQMQPGIETDTRGSRLIAALYRCLADLPGASDYR